MGLWENQIIIKLYIKFFHLPKIPKHIFVIVNPPKTLNVVDYVLGFCQLKSSRKHIFLADQKVANYLKFIILGSYDLFPENLIDRVSCRTLKIHPPWCTSFWQISSGLCAIHYRSRTLDSIRDWSFSLVIQHWTHCKYL